MKTRLLSIISLLIAVSSVSLGAETATVITKENAIRESCRFFSPVRATVHYGDALEIVSQEGDWFRVDFRGVQGCIHKSAIEKKSFSLSNLVGSNKQSTSGQEVALAGKGFNPQVESAYRSQNPQLNFREVNALENYRVPESKLREFIKIGGLNLP
ncbi:MAG: hypothetical protein C4291_07530 [Candidatus Dadabacteria bacterium]